MQLSPGAASAADPTPSAPANKAPIANLRISVVLLAPDCLALKHEACLRAPQFARNEFAGIGPRS
jgi:hypothetical protein